LGPVFLLGGGHDFSLHLVTDLITHRLRHILHPHIPRRCGRAAGNHRRRIGLARLQGFFFGLGDQAVGGVLGQHALLHQQADQVDGDVFRRGNRSSRRLADQGRDDHANRQGQSIHGGNHVYATPVKNH